MLEHAAFLEHAAATRTRATRTTILADLGLGFLGPHADRAGLLAADLHALHAAGLALLEVGQHRVEDARHAIGLVAPVAVQDELRLIAVQLLVARGVQRTAHGARRAPGIFRQAQFAQTIGRLLARLFQRLLHQLLHRLAVPPRRHGRATPALARGLKVVHAQHQPAFLRCQSIDGDQVGGARGEGGAQRQCGGDQGSSHEGHPCTGGRVTSPRCHQAARWAHRTWCVRGHRDSCGRRSGCWVRS